MAGAPAGGLGLQDSAEDLGPSYRDPETGIQQATGPAKQPDEAPQEMAMETEPLLSKNSLGYKKERAAAIVAHSRLRAMCIGIVLCLTIYMILLTARLGLTDTYEWPLYIDFIPLWVLPGLMYLAATDFASTHVDPEAGLGKFMVVTSGFLGSVVVLAFTLLTCLKLSYVIRWPWVAVLTPAWAMLLVAQVLLCFLVPGFIKEDILHVFFLIFMMVWMSALTVLLTSLKLDGQMDFVSWLDVLFPVQLVLVLQICLLEKRRFETTSRLLLLATSLMLPIRLDGILKLQWVIIFTPILFVLLWNTARIFDGKEVGL